MYYFTCDIGGTNARFALFTKKNNSFHLLYSTWLMSQEYDNFISLYEALCKKDSNFAPQNINSCIIALAGLVKEESYAKITNLSWSVDLNEIKKAMPNFPKTLLINDFSAQAMAFSNPESIALIPFFASNKVEFPLLVTGAGTGFGCAFLAKTEHGFFLQPSEVGHQNFYFDLSKKDELALADFLYKEKKLDTINVEHLLSGFALEAIHEFLTKEKKAAKEIESSSPAFALFSRFYARTLKNLSLTYLTKTAIITGGIVAKHEHILSKEFYDEFIKHEKMSEYLKEVMFFLNKNEDIALIGASRYFDKI